MCGIAGIINFSGAAVLSSDIERMIESVSHRGPDAEGVYLKNNIGLGHKRLSIFDLSDSGKQPMHYLDKYVIVFNGAIYNFPELKAELVNSGYKFQSGTDTEVIMAAYDLWGEKCVSRFNGMWSFAIYHSVKEILFCSRDRFGIKPFYYTFADNIFAFGSEIKELLPFQKKIRANRKTLVNYLVLGLEEYNSETFFENIVKLNAGHNLTVDLKSGETQMDRYYTIKPEVAEDSVSEEEMTNEFSKRLEQAIQLRLRSDVKVGTCLSGGLDSSSIAGIASKILAREDKKFSAVTASSLDPSKDEISYARAVAQNSNLDWHVIAPDYEDFHKMLDEVIYLQEEPFGGPSVFMQYFVMKIAKEAKIVVLLDGQGSDEILLGYERYYPSWILSQPVLKRLFAFGKASRYSKLSWKQLLSYMIYFTQPKLRIKHRLKSFPFLKSDYKVLIDVDIIAQLASAQGDTLELQKLELEKTQLPHLLKFEDKNSMHFAIETRLPFLDYKLLEFVLGLPLKMKMNKGWTKFILRKAMRQYIPEEIAWRTNKIGFEAPIKKWLGDRQKFQQLIDESAVLNEVCLPIPINQLDDITFWRVLNIAKWEKLYNVQ